MLGSSLGHYTVTELLGRGGMGEVYRARDERLKRDVALKVLPPEMAGDPARLERLHREAEAVAALNHPHIVTLFSLEEDAGRHFLTMELVEGEPLDRRIQPGGLPLPTVLEIGIALADALAAAHAKGIVHRDLKPANVMIDARGRPKILDFGLAKLARPPAPDREATRPLPLTRAGALLGTAPYMAPEQVRGLEADHRTDLWALGALLHELVTGRRPFEAETLGDLCSAILRDEPPPIAALRPDLPARFARIVARCLEKDPGDRYRSASDLADDLRRLRAESTAGSSRTGGEKTGTSPTPHRGESPAGGRSRPRGRRLALVACVALLLVAVAWMLARASSDPQDPLAPAAAPADAIDPERSIAVLPFADLSPARDQEHFSEGISEELLNLLARIPGLRVISRTSSFAFKGTDATVADIAKRLQVAHLLEGSVRTAGDRVRITAQLIDASRESQLWSHTWDRTLDDLFAIQDEIAADVVAALRVTLLDEAPRARTTDPAAYALYLEASQRSRQSTPEDLLAAEASLRRALEIDPGYAPGWDLLSAVLTNQAAMLSAPTHETYLEARSAAARAVEIDPRYAPAHASLGWLALYADRDLEGAARHLERAFALDPADPRVLNAAAAILQSLGRLEQASRLFRRIVTLDPLNPTWHLNMGNVERWAGRLDQAVAAYRAGLRADPDRSFARYGIGVALLLGGDAGGALEELERETSGAWRLIGLPMAYHALGRAADADAALAELTERHARDAAYNIAYVHAFRGDADLAFEWLERAVDSRDPGLEHLPVESLFANLHDDPRWLPFLRSLGKAPDQLDAIELRIDIATASSARVVGEPGTGARASEGSPAGAAQPSPSRK